MIDIIEVVTHQNKKNLLKIYKN